MKAAVLYAKNDIRYDDFETPVVRPGTIKVKVKMTGICGSDVPRVLGDAAHYFPNVLGHEFAGEVVQLGEGVTSVKLGDKVSGAPLVPCMECDDCQKGNYALCKSYSFIGSREQGSFAQYVVIPERNAVVFDNSLSYEQGALFEPSTVALHGVLCNDFRGGGDVAVLGGGNIGLFAAQWAKILGAKRVVVFDIDNDRLALAKKFGIDETINTMEEGFMDKALDIVGKKGFEFVFETAGVIPTMHMAFELAGNKSNVCFIGTPHKDLCFTPKQWENMNRKEFKLTGSWMSYSAPYPGKEWSMTAHYFANGQLKYDEAMIFKKFPMSEVAQAFKLYEDPRQVKGKILLVNE
jgi:L-iditol 2-dehydrogenase